MLTPYPSYTDEEIKAQRIKCLSQVIKNRKLQLQVVLLFDTTLTQATVMDIVPVILASSKSHAHAFLFMKTHKSKFPISSFLTNVVTNAVFSKGIH